MTLSLLYHRSTAKTAIALSQMLGLHRTKTPTTSDTVVIRWGSSTPAPVDVSINTESAIKLAANGMLSLETLHRHGVPAVEVFRAPPSDPDSYPVFGRRIHHRAGLDIVWVDTMEAETRRSEFFTKYIVMDKELRVHVFGGEVLRVFRKVPRACDADQRVKTSLRGWGYHIVDHTNYYKRAQITAVNAVVALGLTFGAVDIGWNETTRTYYVFEVNTGPALNSITLLHYCSKFEEYLINLEVNYVPTGLHWAREIDSRGNRGNNNE